MKGERMDINEHLATVVMGWKICKFDDIQPFYYKENPRSAIIFTKDWNPLENIDQAFMCLEIFQSRTTK